jgi:hypothetical protein
MADPSIGDVIAGFAPEGPLRTLVIVTYLLCGAAAPFIFNYYLGVLGQGAKPEGSIERNDYDKLRASLKEGNLAARLYAKWLTKFLDWIERFFGDAGMADRTLFPHAFGLKTPAPLWTAPAFDRCLLLALIYPIATQFLTWAISGHVGPAAQSALGLNPDVPGWLRSLAAAAVGFSSFAFWRGVRARGREFLVWILAFLAGAFGVALAGAAAFGRASADAIAGAIFFAFAGAFAIMLSSRIEHRWQGAFLLLFVVAMILAYLGASATQWLTGRAARPMLLFLGLVTLLNAPFDWASLGVTRALLRRGLELGGWWPYLLALVDAVLAGVIIACLALFMVLGAQTFDKLAALSGGTPLMPLDTFFNGVVNNPTAPEFWWAYALLLSTMIPSLINLAIGGMAFTRGVPGVPRLLLHWIPECRDVPDYRRPLAALALTSQMFAGALLGIAAQAFLAWVLLYHLMPAIGLDLLWLCRQLADLDLPGELFHLIGIIR